MASETTQAVDSLPTILPRPITDAEVATFKDKNWVHLEGLLSAQDAAVLLARLKEKMGTGAEQTIAPGEASAGGYGGGMWHRWGPVSVDVSSGDVAEPLFYGFSHSPEMGVLASRLLDAPVRYWVDQALVKVSDSEPTRWHQDSGSIDRSPFAPNDSTIMVWIALDDIPPDRGSMRFVPRKNQTEDFKRIIEATDVVGDTYPELEKLGLISEPLFLRPGDATVHGPSVYHSALANTTDTPRWAYVVSLFRAHATWTGKQHWPLTGVQGMEVGKEFVDGRFRVLATA